MKGQRGKKRCSGCQELVGVRTRVCKCGYQFAAKPKKVGWVAKKRKRKRREFIEVDVTDWRELKPGDKFRAIQGHGPYWESEDGLQRVGMGYSGRFTVIELVHNGIMAWQDCNSRGQKVEIVTQRTVFLYMGRKTLNKDANIVRVPHKLVRKVRNPRYVIQSEENNKQTVKA